MDFRYEFRYSKKGSLAYISHLDLSRVFERSARRADLPVALTSGYHPRLKIKLFCAIKLGLEAEEQPGQIVLREKLGEEDLRQRWQKEFPQGLTISALNFVPVQGQGDKKK